jgi:hypothetical protein
VTGAAAQLLVVPRQVISNLWWCSPCSLGLSSTSQQYFFFSQNKPAISNQPAVLFSQNKPALAISHQPTEHAFSFGGGGVLNRSTNRGEPVSEL